jgi:pimeloyl-ACP methyl ester carboxylesterase
VDQQIGFVWLSPSLRMYHSSEGCEMMQLVKGKTTILVILAVGLVTITVLMGGGWFVSNIIRDRILVPKQGVRHLDLEVVDLTENQITLRATTQTQKDHWITPGIWGLRGRRGFGQVGEILSFNVKDRQVVRKYLLPTGNLKRGDMVQLEAFPFPDDPKEAFGLQTQEVVFSSPLGNFRAWSIEGRSSTWVIFVHGKRDHPPQQPLRAYPILPIVSKLEISSLVITYRNDLGEPESPDGFHWHGQQEWKDLEGAAKYAIEQGAKEFILVGYSMGGAIVVNFLYRSPLAEKVKCAILDSPMLNLSATIDFGGRLIGLPDFLISLGKLIAGIRFNIDWKALDYLRRADELRVPILLFHGDADRTVPVETSEALAKARPDIVSYHRVPGATHIRSWNMNPAAYERAVHNFLAPEK